MTSANHSPSISFPRWCFFGFEKISIKQCGHFIRFYLEWQILDKEKISLLIDMFFSTVFTSPFAALASIFCSNLLSDAELFRILSCISSSDSAASSVNDRPKMHKLDIFRKIISPVLCAVSLQPFDRPLSSARADFLLHFGRASQSRPMPLL